MCSDKILAKKKEANKHIEALNFSKGMMKGKGIFDRSFLQSSTKYSILHFTSSRFDPHCKVEFEKLTITVIKIIFSSAFQKLVIIISNVS